MSYLISKNNERTLNPDKPVFPIGVVADFLNVSIRTIRIYEETGLLIPSRSAKNRRLYSISDVERGKFIQYLSRQLGINFSGIRVIFCLLEQSALKPDKYMDFIKEIAKRLNLEQSQNKDDTDNK